MTHNIHAELVRELTSRWPEHRVAPSLSRVAALMDGATVPGDQTPQPCP